MFEMLVWRGLYLLPLPYETTTVCVKVQGLGSSSTELSFWKRPLIPSCRMCVLCSGNLVLELALEVLQEVGQSLILGCWKVLKTDAHEMERIA